MHDFERAEVDAALAETWALDATLVGLYVESTGHEDDEMQIARFYCTHGPTPTTCNGREGARAVIATEAPRMARLLIAYEREGDMNIDELRSVLRDIGAIE